MTDNYSLSDIAAVTDSNRNNGMFGNEWAWIIILLLFGWGRNGFGGYGGSYGGGVGENYVLATDFANIERKLDGVNNGICDSTFALNNTINANFRTLDNAVCTLGYQGAQHANNLSSQLASCCCGIERAIDGNTTSGVMNTNSLSRQISDCCCELEKMNMQNRFDAQAYNCNTLQAIDASTDRILKYLQDEKTQALRDENFALRLAASQAQQNEALINKLSPCPSPAYVVPNPNCCYNANVTYSNCGCGCGTF